MKNIETWISALIHYYPYCKLECLEHILLTSLSYLSYFFCSHMSYYFPIIRNILAREGASMVMTVYLIKFPDLHSVAEGF